MGCEGCVWVSAVGEWDDKTRYEVWGVRGALRCERVRRGMKRG